MAYAEFPYVIHGFFSIATLTRAALAAADWATAHINAYVSLMR